VITEDRLWIPCSDCGELRMQEHLTLIADNGEGERARYVCDPGCGIDLFRDDRYLTPYAVPQSIPSYREIGVLVAVIAVFFFGMSVGYYIAADKADAMWKNYAATEVNR
jgi:hypothetical protein